MPDPAYPFLGVHFTRRIGGGVDVGPNAVLAFAREGYRQRDVRLRDLAETLRSRGFRRARAVALAQRRPRAARLAVEARVRRRGSPLRPGRWDAADLVPAPAGVRAQALDPDGSLVDDFRIGTLGRVTAVRNAPSPGATSSLAIAEHIADVVFAR